MQSGAGVFGPAVNTWSKGNAGYIYPHSTYTAVETTVRPVNVEEDKMSGFVFMIHANLDPEA
ncbi:MAG: hypothetical protein IPF69_12895 [Chitinophagaceae bacterium]|nr:hypothetical protein [Chitinophagaceae bacterium]